MSVIKFILFLFLYLFGQVPYYAESTLTISTDKFGPFAVYQPDTQLTLNLYSSERRTMIVKFVCGPSKDDLRSLYTSKTLTFRGSYQTSIRIPTYFYMGYKGLYCRIDLNKTSGESFMSMDFHIYPLTAGANIDVSKYYETGFSVNNVAYQITNNVFYNFAETFSFTDYQDYFSIDTYHRISLSDVSFSSNLRDNLTYSSAEMTFYDVNNIFPYLDHDENKYIHIPLTITGRSKSYFAFKNYMYVDPKTLQMSTTYREGFTQTRYFYLPVNHKQDLLEEYFYIQVLDAGVGKTNITFPVQYLGTTNIIGPCSNSDYCIVGG